MMSKERINAIMYMKHSSTYCRNGYGSGGRGKEFENIKWNKNYFCCMSVFTSSIVVIFNNVGQ